MANVARCAYCGARIVKDTEGWWIDDTGSDSCGGSDTLENENQAHTPIRYSDEQENDAQH